MDPVDSQAKAFFQWCNYLRDRAAATGKEALYVNLDETPVPICFTHVRGNVVRRGQRSRPRQLATRADTRLYFTLVAMICTEPELQPFLPQLMVVSEKTLRKQDEPAVRAILPDNVYLLRRKSGWNNIETQAEIVTLTKHVLGAHLDRYQVIWISDACKAHFAPKVMRHMSAAGFWYCVIPAKLTWLLQPLDVSTFVLFKRFLKQEFADSLGHPSAEPNVVRMMRIVVRGVRRILQGHAWRKAFAQVGALGSQDTVSASLKLELGWEAVPVMPRNRPGTNEVELCLPRDIKMSPLTHASCLPAVAAAASAIADVDACAEVMSAPVGGTCAASSAATSCVADGPLASAAAAIAEARAPVFRLREKTPSWAACLDGAPAPETPP